MLALLIAAPIWVVDTLGWCDKIAPDGAALNPTTQRPGSAYLNGDTVFFCENLSGIWGLDTLGVFLKPSLPSLDFDLVGNPHLTFTSCDSFLIYANKNGGDWKVETVFVMWNIFYPRMLVMDTVPHILFLDKSRHPDPIYTFGVIYLLRKTESGWDSTVIDHGEVGFDYPYICKIWDIKFLSPCGVYNGQVEAIYGIRYETYHTEEYNLVDWANKLRTIQLGEFRSGKEIDFRLNAAAKNNWRSFHWFDTQEGRYKLQRGQSGTVNLPWGARVPDIGFLNNGTPALSYSGGQLIFATLTNTLWWWTDTVPGTLYPDTSTSLVIDSQNHVYIFFSNSQNILCVAHKLYTGTEEAPVQNPHLLPGTVFARGQEVRLDREYELAIYDLSGRVLLSGRMESFSTASLSPGVYVFEVKGLGRQGFVVR